MTTQKDYTIYLVTTKLGIAESQRLWIMASLKPVIEFAASRGLRVKVRAFGLSTEKERQYGLDSSVWNLRLPQHCDLELLACPRDKVYAEPLIFDAIKDADEVWCFSGARLTPLTKTRPAWVYFGGRGGKSWLNKFKTIPVNVEVEAETISLNKGVKQWKSNWN